METLVAFLFNVVLITGPVVGGVHGNDEPHWSFRDGCTVQKVLVPASGGGYSYESYDHCKTLPRVYGGKSWTPYQSKSTNPSA